MGSFAEGFNQGAETLLAVGQFATSVSGTYTVDVFLVREGEVVAAQATPLVVSKIGVGADMADIAHRYAALYGIIAVLVAGMAGWLAGIIFRRN